MKQMLSEGSYINMKIAEWAKTIGAEGVTNEVQGKNTSFQYKIAKKFVYSKIR
jgi:long-subunit acyl-CoA synthetase (AMP-forming)